MRILAFSDIHNNLNCLDRLLEQVAQESFDCIIIAGDIGSECIDDFFLKLNIFSCPIYYVLGNWDSKIRYDRDFGENVFHLHNTVLENSGFYFTGFSGCTTHWGENDLNHKIMDEQRASLRNKHSKILGQIKRAESKIEKLIKNPKIYVSEEYLNSNHFVDPYIEKAQLKLDELIYSSEHFEYEAEYEEAMMSARSKVYHDNRQMIFELILKTKKENSSFNTKKLIVITHDRFAKLNHYLPWPPLAHVFGHVHTFNHTYWQNIHFINVSHLDDTPHEHPLYKPKNLKPVGGNFCLIELNENGVKSEKVILV